MWFDIDASGINIKLRIKGYKTFEIKRIVDDFINRPGAKRITQDEVNDLYNKLLVYSQVDEATKQRHVDNIKKTGVQGAKLGNEAVKAVETQEETIAEEVERVTVSEEKEVPVHVEPTEIAKQEEPKAVNNKACPLCGKELVLRTARYGKYAGREFLGCSGYPKCNYIKNLE